MSEKFFEQGLAAALREYVYVVAQDKIARRSDGALISRSAFNTVMTDIAPAGAQGTKSALGVFMNEGGPCADDLSYAPGKDVIFTRQASGKSETVFNRWRRGPIAPSPLISVDPKEVALWLDHVNFILPDPVARELFLNFAATLIQHPGRKINFGYLLLGEQGIGKDLLLLPISKILGQQNVKPIRSSHLASPHNSYLESQLVVVGELPAFHKRDFYDELKDYLAPGQPHIQVADKYVRQYWIENCANWFLFSNHRDALALPDDDRRAFAYWSPAEKQDPDYYRRLARAYERETFLQKLATFLNDRDLSGFNPGEAPPMTEAKQAMSEYARDPVDAAIAEMFEAGGAFCGRELITPAEVLAEATTLKFDQQIDEETARKITPHRIGKRLARLGAVKLAGKHRVRLKASAPEYVWALSNHPIYARIVEQGDIDELRELFQEDQTKQNETGDSNSTEAEIVDLSRRREGAADRRF